MSGIKKLFKKKQTPVHEIQESSSNGYISMNSEGLSKLSSGELLNIIYRFNKEVQLLNKEASERTAETNTLKDTVSKLSDEMNLHKSYNEKLNQELHTAMADFNEVSMALHSKSTELGLAREQLEAKEELISSYKAQIEALKEQPSEKEDTDHAPEKSRKKSKKIKILKQQIHELTITNKMLENDVHKHNLLSENLEEQAKAFNSKLEETENKNKDLELALHKANIELQMEKRQFNVLQFQKESLETENKTMKEGIIHKDKKINKSKDKEEKMNKLIAEKEHKILYLEEQMASVKEYFTGQSQIVEEKFKESFEHLTHQVEKLSESLTDIENKQENTSNLPVNSEKPANLTQQSERTGKPERLVKLEEENSKLEKKVENLQQKLEVAKKELINVCQKQRTKELIISPSKSDTFTLASLEDSEVDALTSVKNELDDIYKRLMVAMSSTPQAVQFKVNEFMVLEKRLNNVVMNLHETIDSKGNSSSGKLRAAILKRRHKQPLGLFGCIKSEGDMHTVKTVKGKQLISYTGNIRHLDSEPSLRVKDDYRSLN